MEMTTTRGGTFKGTADAGSLEELEVAPQLRLQGADDNVTFTTAPALRFARNTLSLNYGTLINSPRRLDDQPDPLLGDAVARLKVQLLTAEIEVDELSARLKTANGSLVGARTERDALKLEIEQIRNADANSPLIADLADQVATSFSKAATSDPGKSKFHLGHAKVSLKGYLTDGGVRFKPLDVAEAASAHAEGASEISFDLHASTPETAAALTMPDLIGLTPPTARRTIRPLGVEVQVIETIGAPVGAVIKQHPEPGQEMQREDTVMLQVAISRSEG